MEEALNLSSDRLLDYDDDDDDTYRWIKIHQSFGGPCCIHLQAVCPRTKPVYYTDSEDGVARTGGMSVTTWCHAGTYRSGGIAPVIINIILDGGEQASTRPGRFNPG